MNCHDTRRLLDRGVIPGPSDPQRATLGFHLSGCADCRIYRKETEDLRVLHALLAQQLLAPHTPAVAARRRRHLAARPLRVAGAAILIGGALALVPCAGLMPTPAVAAQADPTLAMASRVYRDDVPVTARSVAGRAAQSDAVPTTVGLLAGQASQRDNAALLQDLLGISDTPAAMRAERAREMHLARAELAPGQALIIPEQAGSAAADVASKPETAPPQQAQSSYVVRAGDSLWLIAQRFYGNGALWGTIYDANKTVIGNNPSLIFPDQRFTIPNVPPGQPPQSGQGIGLYTIVSGDTLTGIAFHAYGNAGRWIDIYNRNRVVIGNNPDLIFPGTVLDMPPR